MTSFEFQRGAAYFATNAIPGEPKRVMICVGRDGHEVMFCRLGGNLRTVDVDWISGREFCQIHEPDGVYNISAASVADIECAANVLNAVG